MKVFQVFNGFCHWDATPLHPTLDSIGPGQYHPDIKFVEAPDNVFEGWGFDGTLEGDARFIQPTPIDNHWLYDPATGAFIPNPDDPPIPPEVPAE